MWSLNDPTEMSNIHPSSYQRAMQLKISHELTRDFKTDIHAYNGINRYDVRKIKSLGGKMKKNEINK